MEISDILKQVAKQLRQLFATGGELRGFDDWDKFLGCVMTIEQLAEKFEVKEEVDDG